MSKNPKNKTQSIQEEEYSFPYHYIPEISEKGFTQVKHWSWGYRYLGGLRVVIDQLNKIRIQRAHKFKNKLEKFRELTFQKVPQKYKHVYHCIVAKYEGKKYKKNKDDFISLLWKKFKIQCIVQNRPLYKYDLFKKNGFKNSNCPKSDVFFDNMISWPFYVWMSDKEFNYMINSTISVLQELRSK
mgnify:CR=1 FL=1